MPFLKLNLSHKAQRVGYVHSVSDGVQLCVMLVAFIKTNIEKPITGTVILIVFCANGTIIGNGICTSTPLSDYTAAQIRMRSATASTLRA